jgi:hypothetical protein
MTRLGTKVGVLAVLVALCYAAPASADEDKGGQDPVEKLRRDVAELKKKVADLQRARKLDLELADREKELFDARLRRLEDDLDRLRSRANSTSRRQFSFDPSLETGTLYLRNTLDVPATVTIEGVPYTVRARSIRTIDVPVGAIRYSVTAEGMGVTRRETTVRTSDPKTITIFP